MKLLFFILLSIVFTPEVYAQDRRPRLNGEIQKYAYRANPVFEGMVRDALNNQPSHLRFTEFRRQYALTSQYAPIADKVVDEMLVHAFNAQNAQNPKNAQKSYDSFQNLTMKHMANLKVVLQALSLARTDKRFGNVKALSWVRTGLLKNLMISGDGNSLHGAYDVITLEEETLLLEFLGVDPEQTISQREGIMYYNMHDYIDKETGRASTLFVNTTYPMRFLEARAEQDQKARINIRRQ